MRIQRLQVRAWVGAKAGAKAPQLWSIWCESHPAPRITVAFLIIVLMLAAFALTQPGHLPALQGPGGI